MRLDENALIAMVTKLCPTLPPVIPYLITAEIMKSRLSSLIS